MARLKFTGDSTGLVKEQRKVRKETKLMDDEFKSVLETNKQLEAQVKRTWENARTPLERYNDKVRRLNDLRKQNKISEEQYNLAVSRTEAAYRRLENQQKKTFPLISNQITSFVGQLATVETAINTVKDALEDLDQFQQTQADRERTRIQELVKLYTLQGTAAQRAGFVEQALQLEAEGVQRGAGASIFAAESAVLNTPQNRALIRDLQNVQLFGDPAETNQVISSAGKLITNFPDVDNLNQALGRLQAVSGVTQADVFAIGRAAPTVAGLAGQQDIMSDEGLAALSVLSDALKSTETASEQFAGLLKEFASGTDKFDITGKTLNERLGKIDALLEKGVPLGDIFTTDTAKIAATFLLRDREEFLRRAGVTAASTGVRGTLDQVMQDPNLGPMIEAESRRRVAEFRGRPEGQRRVRTQAALDEQVAEARATGEPFAGFAARRAGRLAQFAGLGEEAVAGAASLAAQSQEVSRGLIPSIDRTAGIIRMIEELVLIRRNTERATTSGGRPEN